MQIRYRGCCRGACAVCLREPGTVQGGTCRGGGKAGRVEVACGLLLADGSDQEARGDFPEGEERRRVRACDGDAVPLDIRQYD